MVVNMANVCKNNRWKKEEFDEKIERFIVESDKNTLIELYKTTKKRYYITENIDKYNAI